jgi:hypothetical protein
MQISAISRHFISLRPKCSPEHSHTTVGYSNLFTLKTVFFWIITARSSEMVQRFGGAYRLCFHAKMCAKQETRTRRRAQLLLASCLIYSSNLKMEAIYSFQTLGSPRAAGYFNPQGCTVYSHWPENLRSNITVAYRPVSRQRP